MVDTSGTIDATCGVIVDACDTVRDTASGTAWNPCGIFGDISRNAAAVVDASGTEKNVSGTVVDDCNTFKGNPRSDIDADAFGAGEHASGAVVGDSSGAGEDASGALAGDASGASEDASRTVAGNASIVVEDASWTFES